MSLEICIFGCCYSEDDQNIGGAILVKFVRQEVSYELGHIQNRFEASIIPMQTPWIVFHMFFKALHDKWSP